MRSSVPINLTCAEHRKQYACQCHIDVQSRCPIGEEGQGNRCDEPYTQICRNIKQDFRCEGAENRQRNHLPENAFLFQRFAEAKPEKDCQQQNHNARGNPAIMIGQIDQKIIGAKHRGICQQIGLCFRKGCTFAQKNAVGKDGFQLCRKVAAAHRVTGRDENRIQAFPAIPIPKRCIKHQQDNQADHR